MAMVSSIIYIYCVVTFVVSHAIDYTDIIDTSKPEEFVDFTEDDFNLRYEDYLGVDMKQIIKDELTKEGQQLDAKVTTFLNNPIQGSGKFEGDIEIPTEAMVDLSAGNDPESRFEHIFTIVAQVECPTTITNLTIIIYHNSFSASAYAAIKRKQKLWVDGIIPYRISSNYGFLSKLHIIAAVKEINKNTCLKMVPYTDHDDYIVIKPKIGCSSFIGRVGGVQHVSISAGCTEKVTIIHEVMHAAGFYHEQARFDRDEHITIHWKNIDPDPKIRSQFKKQNASVISTFGIPYDQHSIMHYQYDAFASQSGLVTISAINNEPLGNAKGLTKSDIDKLNTLYDCPGKPNLSVFEKNVSNLTTTNVNDTVNDRDLILTALEGAWKPPGTPSFAVDEDDPFYNQSFTITHRAHHLKSRNASGFFVAILDIIFYSGQNTILYVDTNTFASKVAFTLDRTKMSNAVCGSKCNDVFHLIDYDVGNDNRAYLSLNWYIHTLPGGFPTVLAKIDGSGTVEKFIVDPCFVDSTSWTAPKKPNQLMTVLKNGQVVLTCNPYSTVKVFSPSLIHVRDLEVKSFISNFDSLSTLGNDLEIRWQIASHL